jgi:excisionase family DNA binding protein
VPALVPWQLVGRFRQLPVNNHMRNEHHHTIELLKPSEVAVQLGVSRTWLYDAAKTGRIPAIRIGGPEGPLRFVPEDIQRWIDDARTAWLPGGPALSTRSALNRLSVTTQQGTPGRLRSRR